MKEGDVILSPVPQADGKVKNRPAITGSIDAISTERHQRLLKTLSSYLVKDCTP